MWLPTQDHTHAMLALLLTSSFVALVALAAYRRYRHPLSKYPGPFWASVTNFWYFRTVRYGTKENGQLPLHKKYGKFVRIGPDILAISDPAAIDTVYGIGRKAGKPFKKSDFYKGFWSDMGPRQDSFSELDPAKHAERRRIQAPLYTQGNILSYEPCIDRLVTLFQQRMQQFCDSEEVFDISLWLRRYTFDVLGEIFFGRDGGFGMFIFELIFGGKSSRTAVSGLTQVVSDAKRTVNEHLEALERPEAPETKRKDMLNVLLKVVKTRGEELDWTTLDCTTEIWGIIWAGADTTAIALTAIFYYTHKHPDVLAKLRREIDDAYATGQLSKPVRFNDVIKLPYLSAVVKESMRVFPSLGNPGLPRVVPEPGAEIAGR